MLPEVPNISRVYETVLYSITITNTVVYIEIDKKFSLERISHVWKAKMMPIIIFHKKLFFNLRRMHMHVRIILQYYVISYYIVDFPIIKENRKLQGVSSEFTFMLTHVDQMARWPFVQVQAVVVFLDSFYFSRKKNMQFR